jgi:ABC-type transporter Mla maintaining outer membrane lipid asymmetry ATPase subunit MlaF
MPAILHRSRHSHINVSIRTSGLFGLKALLTERLRGSVTRICTQRRTEARGPARSPPGPARSTGNLDLILADEPTGNLDAASGDEILTLLAQLSKKFGKTVVMAIHDLHAAEYAGSVYHLEKGNLLPSNAGGRTSTCH